MIKERSTRHFFENELKLFIQSRLFEYRTWGKKPIPKCEFNNEKEQKS